MDRYKAKALLPVLTALANGETIQANLNGIWVDRTDPAFDLPPECYRIAKPKEKIPLEAEDWIKDGPWWIRAGSEDKEPVMVVRVNEDGIVWIGPNGGSVEHSWKSAMRILQRRNAASDWMPCWKEKE